MRDIEDAEQKRNAVVTRQNCEGMRMIMQKCNKPVGRCAFHCSLSLSQRLNVLLYILNKKSLMESTQPYVFSQTLCTESYFKGIVVSLDVWFTLANCIAKPISFLVASSHFFSFEIRKRGGNIKETTSCFISDTTVSHATTLW